MNIELDSMDPLNSDLDCLIIGLFDGEETKRRSHLHTIGLISFWATHCMFCWKLGKFLADMEAMC